MSKKKDKNKTKELQKKLDQFQADFLAIQEYFNSTRKELSKIIDKANLDKVKKSLKK